MQYFYWFKIVQFRCLSFILYDPQKFSVFVVSDKIFNEFFHLCY